MLDMIREINKEVLKRKEFESENLSNSRSITDTIVQDKMIPFDLKTDVPCFSIQTDHRHLIIISVL